MSCKLTLNRPPGSGKTKTIVAIVGALLTDALRDRGTIIRRPGMTNGQPNANVSTSKKLLVCAPSNAAVDELVLRFKEGIKTTSGQDRKVNVVRLGKGDKINPQVVEVTLDELVSAKLKKASGSSEEQRAQTHKLMQEHKEVSQKLNNAYERRDVEDGKGTNAAKIQDDIEVFRRRKKELSALIDQAKDKESMMNRQSDLERKRAQQQVLDEAHVLCATLSASGHDMFQNLSLEFETVVVDEAAQCTELAALIPLKYGCAKCILVGDPKQLPPTVFSKQAMNFQYEQSLFVRMQSNRPDDVHLLDTQYRMHPEISTFPSNSFYDGRLLDGPDMARLREKPWHQQLLLGPYRFFDVEGQQTSKGSSLINKMEINAAMQLFEKLTVSYPTYDFKGKVGIISTYKAQFIEMKSQFVEAYGKGIVDTIEFNTTDAFQGRECEIIIFSCVRASDSGSIGFLKDIRRMNVGLTRAKCSLWVLGNSKSLMNGEFWRKMIEDARNRDRLSPAAHIGSMKGGKSVVAAKISSRPPDVVKQESKTDAKVHDSSGVDSMDSSRRSSESSFNTEQNKIGNGSAKYSIKREKRDDSKRFIEDVEMEDVFSDKEKPLVEELKPIVKMEESKPPPAPAQAPPAANHGFLAPRGPSQIPHKRRQTAPNPLMERKRPKKK